MLFHTNLTRQLTVIQQLYVWNGPKQWRAVTAGMKSSPHMRGDATCHQLLRLEGEMVA